jgi:hypothetical protein
MLFNTITRVQSYQSLNLMTGVAWLSSARASGVWLIPNNERNPYF